MIVTNLTNVQYPLSLTDSYWLQAPRDGAPFYSPTSFYFASADGSRLVPAMADEERFITVLTTEIASLAGFSCVPGLQSILDKLTADNTPPAPRYPSIGDTNVNGRVEVVYSGPAFIQLQSRSATPPPGWQGPWQGPLWFGQIVADIAANGYSAPPARLVEAYSDEIGQFRFAFKMSTAVQCGPCTFSIEQGYDYTGSPSVPVARSVVKA